MQKNVCNRASYSSFIRDNGYPQWNSSLDWLLATANLQKLNESKFEKGEVLTHETEQKVYEYKVEADKGISQIQDPLWQRVCIDILKVLGPIAFKDLWKTNFLSISPEGRRAHLTCPTHDIAETIEKYHFVVIEALKKFYPSLFSIETEVC